MKRGPRPRLAPLVVAALALSACGRPALGPPPAHAPAALGDDVRLAKGVPPIAVVARDGDPRGALAVAVATGGLADRGAEPAVALAALVEARLEARGIEALVTPGWDGYRARVLAADSEARRVIEALRVALLTPVGADAPELARVRRKLGALSARPMRDAALLDAVRCTGEAFGSRPRGAQEASTELTSAELEGWRAQAHGIGRVGFAAAGPAALGESAAAALARAGAWPETRAPAADGLPSPDAPAEVYDASGDAPAGTARATIAVHLARASQAVALADALGDARGTLGLRLRALEGSAKVREVVAGAHPRGGCVALTLEIAGKDAPQTEAPLRVATAVGVARQEIAAALADVPAEPARTKEESLGTRLARRAGDPRDAAERAAWWALTAPEASLDTPRLSIAIGVGGGRDGAPRDAAPAEARAAGAREAIVGALARVAAAAREPVVEAHTRTERGQGEVWVLVGSPCGTSAEGRPDAGLAALAMLATAREDLEAPRPSGAPEVEPWITPDGVGVLAHAPARPGETAGAQARRIADAAARAFAGEPLDLGRASSARARLLQASEQDDRRAFSLVAEAVAPGHPSWLSPFGTSDALGRSSDLAVTQRLAALRAGPVRVAVLANADATQGDLAARAVERWIARRPNEARACPAPSAPAAPKAGTYGVDAEGASEAEVAAPLPSEEGARATATTLAHALDGTDGLLAKALGSGLARSWSARVVGGARAAALVVRVSTAPGALDGAVAQTRALLDRLRQGGLTDADLGRARAAQSRADVTAAFDPRQRLAALWRAEAAPAPPSLDALHAFCAKVLRDDALVLVAVRPRLPKP